MQRGRRVGATALAVIGLALSVAACGSSKSGTSSAPTVTNGKESLPPGDIPDNQVYVTYASGAGGYALQYPQGWAQTRSGSTTLFRQNFNSIAVTSASAPTAPTPASVRARDLAALRSQPGYKAGTISTITRPAGTAVRITYAVTSAADPVTGKTVPLDVERYVFWHRGRTVTITLSSAKGSDNVDPWKTVTDSLTWK